MLSYITNWGSDLVPDYVENMGSGPVRVLDSRVLVFSGFLETRYITITNSLIHNWVRTERVGDLFSH